MKYLLGIDFGGGASKATLLSEKGKVVSESTAEYPTIYTDNGGCEQNPHDWIKALCENVKAVLESVDAKDIKAIVDDKAKYAAWSAREDIKAELKVIIILKLAEYKYPPVTQDEVYKEVLEQAENFRKYSV